ncbi:MAG: hypothetical protein IJZ00_09625 [Lachnospiraceae bacterium]|nr:hypothetical protein [Lachnospiraceae bacterium]
MTTKNSKKQNINIIVIAFGAIIIYIAFLVFNYMNKNTISAYQVKEGSLAISNIYTGIALREETVYQCNNSGFIDYFAREGEHVGVGDLIYTIDESGIIDELISGGEMGENSMSDESLNDLREEVINFSAGFESADFDSTYDFLYALDGTVLKLANMNILESLSAAGNGSYADLVKLNRASDAGYVVYNVDGYESLSVNGITPEMFEQTDYEREQLINNTLVDSGDTVYKMISSEDWQIVIPLEKERAEELAQEGYVEIRFLSNQQTLWASIETLQIGENYYGILGLNNSVVSFCTERFIEIELMSSAEVGLKIPLSSIVYKEFFLIPKEYAVEQSEENTYLFMRKTFLEDGTVSTETLVIEVYAENEEYYYVDDSQLRTGDYLIMPGTLNEYPVSTRGELVGVYNINKGYADFRQIVILYQNEEYAIVKSNTAYGLNVYDYIVLDSATVHDDDFIYE